MTATTGYLAFDLGASSGRAVLGRFDGRRLVLDEVHRFPNDPIALPRAGGESLHWDVLRLFAEIKDGIGRAVRAGGSHPVSLGIDTWGVDFGLLDSQGGLAGCPYHYRDTRTIGMIEEACRRVPREDIFETTGIQFLPLNTLTQLLAMVVRKDPTLVVADRLLMIADLFNYWLTGHAVSELTIASTTQCLDARTGTWASQMLQRLDIPAHIFPPLVAPGTVLGRLRREIASELGSEELQVIAPGCHDTASAVAAIPAQTPDYAYISSGTWSLMGMETAHPVISPAALASNFTNEIGVCGTNRLLKNLAGMWILEECRRTWAREGRAISWDELSAQAAAAQPFLACIDPDASEFVAPGDMPARIRDYCHQSGQASPSNAGEVSRVVLESMALKYRWVLARAEKLAGHEVAVLHIVGGGSRNRLLNQLTANAIRRPVAAGPAEATAAGNVLMQMLAAGEIDSLREGREIIRESFAVEICEPRPEVGWEEVYGHFAAHLAARAAS